MKLLLLSAMLGHILCGFTDCLFTYGPNGKVDLSSLKDYEKAHKNFEGMSLKNLMLGMILGVLALTVSVFGYIGLADWMSDFSKTSAMIMYIATIVYFVPIASHHVFCGTVEWFFVKLGRTRQALQAVSEFFQKTAITMYVGYLGLLVFAVTFFIAVVTGQSDLPRWACIFNTLPIFIVLAPTKLPAKGNIAGAVMFLGLLCMM